MRVEGMRVEGLPQVPQHAALVWVGDALFGEGSPNPLREGGVAVDWLVSRVGHDGGAAGPNRAAVSWVEGDGGRNSSG